MEEGGYPTRIQGCIYTNGKEILKAVTITEASLSYQLLERYWRNLLYHLNVHLEQTALLPESKYGFRKDKGTIDIIFTARQLQEINVKNKLELYIACRPHQSIQHSQS